MLSFDTKTKLALRYASNPIGLGDLPISKKYIISKLEEASRCYGLFDL